MRLEQHNHEHRTRSSTNGSAQNGSSPHTNGSAPTSASKSNGAEAETNGYHHAETNGHSEDQQVLGRQDRSPFLGHDREEVTRILLQSLSDLGYGQAAKQLSKESGYELEIPSVAAFRSAVLCGEWEEAEALLFGSEEVDGGVAISNGHGGSNPSWRKGRGASFGAQNGYARHGLPLAEGADITALKFLLRQQKYLELLENGELNAALNVLRNELTPLKRDVGRVHALSSLIMSPTPRDLRITASWDGAKGESRHHLLSVISRSISPSVMIPEHRFATLLQSFQTDQILSCRYHNTTIQPSLYTDHECSADDFPLQSLIDLRSHGDEVWFLEFSHDGSMLATAGKDGMVCVYDTARWKVRHEYREHERHTPTYDRDRGNDRNEQNNRGVCYIAFSPDDQYLISCSQANEFVVISMRDGRRVAMADHFDYPVTTAAWLPDSQHFVIGTQSGRRPLGLYSVRPANGGTSSSSIVRNQEIFSWRDPPFDPTLKDQPPSFRITDCAVSQDGSRMVAATLSNKIMLYDLRSRLKIAEWQMEDKITSICFSEDGEEMLVSMMHGRVLLLDAGSGDEAGEAVVKMRFDGATQKEFVVRSTFGGAAENFVVSGSEDSRVYIWRRETGMLVATLEGHGPGTVNAVAWHPTNPAVFASAGDDRRVRIWQSASSLRPQSAASAGPGASRTSLGIYGSAYPR